jgi:hypothetical protein
MRNDPPPSDPPHDPTPTPPSKWVENRFTRVGIRTVRTWLQVFVALLLASGFGAIGVQGAAGAIGSAAPSPPTVLEIVRVCAYTALFPALIGFLQNLLEELNRLDPGTSLRG